MRPLDLDELWPAAAPESFRKPALALENPVRDSTGSSPSLPLFDPPLSTVDQTFQGPGLIDRVEAGFRSCVSSLRTVVRSFDHVAAVHASIGFVAGMAAWHAIGFWGFVSNTVLHDPAQITTAAVGAPRTTPAKPSPATSSITTGSINQTVSAPTAASNCVALVRDDVAKQVTVGICANNREAMRDAGKTRRADRLPDVMTKLQSAKSWEQGTGFETGSEATPSASTAPPVAASTLTPGDINLDLTDYQGTKLSPN